jgi:predicted RNA binding protein YcfA (HicA-like mRNA interferase family)
MKVKDVLKLFKSGAWTEVSRRGSHRQLKPQTKKGRVAAPGKPPDNLAPGTLNSILKQAG